MRNILKALDMMVTVYDSFCGRMGDEYLPLSIFDTESWAAVGEPYEADATLNGNGIMIDFERALETGEPAFVLAHEFAHVEQLMDGVKFPKRQDKHLEKDADERAKRILEQAGFKLALKRNERINQRKKERL